MNYMPLAIILFPIYLDAIICHVYQSSVGKELVGQHGHILSYLDTRHTEIITLGKQFAIDGLQKLGDGLVVVNPLVRHAVEIGEATF